jgi:hypothetical protein
MFTLPHLTSSVVHPVSSLRNNSGIQAIWGRILYRVYLATSTLTIWAGTLTDSQMRVGVGFIIVRNGQMLWAPAGSSWADRTSILACMTKKKRANFTVGVREYTSLIW